MAYLVEMMDGIIVDLDNVIAISDIRVIGITSNFKLDKITGVVFDLILKGPIANTSFRNVNSNGMSILLERLDHYIAYGFDSDTNIKAEFIKTYRLGLQYPRYLAFIELFKKHKNCETVVKV